MARPSPSCCALSGGSGGPPDRPYTHKLRIGHANMAWRNLSTAERSDTARVRIALPGPWRNLGYRVSDQTVGNILKRHSIPPAPEREKSTTWNEFIRSHMEVLAATDFFTTEVCTKSGLVTYYVLFFMHLATRRVHIAGITPYPDGQWMTQVARNVTMADVGFLCSTRYSIHDRDSKFCESFQLTLEAVGIKTVKLPARSPNLNSFAERWVKSVKEEWYCQAGESRPSIVGLEDARSTISWGRISFEALNLTIPLELRQLSFFTSRDLVDDRTASLENRAQTLTTHEG